MRVSSHNALESKVPYGAKSQPSKGSARRPALHEPTQPTQPMADATDDGGLRSSLSPETLAFYEDAFGTMDPSDGQVHQQFLDLIKIGEWTRTSTRRRKYDPLRLP